MWKLAMAKKRRTSSGRLQYPLADKERASILILTLWTLSLLAAFSVTLSYGVRQKLTLIKRLDERDRLSLIADAALQRAIIQIKKEEEDDVEALNQGWSNNSEAFNEIPIGGGTFTIAYEYKDELSEGIVPRYGLVDEESKININTAQTDVLERLFRIVFNDDEMKAQELAASIIDWRDSDSQLSLPLGSAEDGYYRGLAHPYEAKDERFESLDELMLVKGVDEDTLRMLRGYITAYGGGRVNVNTAPKVVLLALGLKESTVNAILLFRAGDDGAIGTPDDNIFDSASTLSQRLSQSYHLSEPDALQLQAVESQYLTTNSTAFTAAITAVLHNKKQPARAVAVIDTRGKILYWQES